MQALLFDLNDVSFRFDATVRWQGFATLCNLPPAEIRRRLQDSGFSQACDSGRLRGERALRECGRLLSTRLSMERFRDIWVSAFTPDPDVLELVKAAKQRIAVGLLTNNSDIVREGLEIHFPAQIALFGPRLFSADIGILKPDPRSYACALDLLELPAQACLLVDAAPQSTDTAAALGFAVHCYRNPGSLRQTLVEAGLLD